MIVIGSYEFKTKKEATDVVRKIMTKLFERDEKIINQGSDHWKFFLDLVQRHPTRKIDSFLVEYFEIIRNFAGHIAINYKLHRSEPESFSWLKCIHQNEISEKNKLRQAMRKAIRWQIISFREKCKKEFCDICFCNLSETKTHVDHVVPFELLCTDFTNNKNTPKKFNVKKDHSGISFLFENSTFELEWSNYHQNNAILRLLCEKCNTTR